MNKVKEQFKLSIMKKYLPFSSCRCFKFTSCTVTDDVYVEDTPVSQVFEVPSFTASNYYSKQVVFNSKIFCISFGLSFNGKLSRKRYLEIIT
jgi:hypothetical protein